MTATCSLCGEIFRPAVILGQNEHEAFRALVSEAFAHYVYKHPEVNKRVNALLLMGTHFLVSADLRSEDEAFSRLRAQMRRELESLLFPNPPDTELPHVEAGSRDTCQRDAAADQIQSAEQTAERS